MNQLLYLPADILHKIASDAGYVDSADTTQTNIFVGQNEYGNYYKAAQQQQQKNYFTRLQFIFIQIIIIILI